MAGNPRVSGDASRVLLVAGNVPAEAALEAVLKIGAKVGAAMVGWTLVGVLVGVLASGTVPPVSRMGGIQTFWGKSGGVWTSWSLSRFLPPVCGPL